jgi:chemotaxis protein CheZ
MTSECANVSNVSDGKDVLEPFDELVGRLGATLTALGWDSALHQLAAELPDARERLAYVGQMTEDAAMKVLSMVEAAQPGCQTAAAEATSLAETLRELGARSDVSWDEARAALAQAAKALGGHAAMAQSQNSTLTDIMMAQDFQDLSGQVIKKVVKIISNTEQQLCQLLAQTQGQTVQPQEPGKLEGPQVPDKAVGQEDVDDLLASLGF